MTPSTDTENHETLNSGDGEAPYKAFSTRYRNYVLGLLTLGYVFNFVDRQVMTILLEPIKAEFNASDTQKGLLSLAGICTVLCRLGHSCGTSCRSLVSAQCAGNFDGNVECRYSALCHSR